MIKSQSTTLIIKSENTYQKPMSLLTFTFTYYSYKNIGFTTWILARC